MKNINVLKGIALAIILAVSTGASAGQSCAITVRHTFESKTQRDEYYCQEYDKTYLGFTGEELLLVAISIGIGFAIAEYHVHVKHNSITVSVPVK